MKNLESRVLQSMQKTDVEKIAAYFSRHVSEFTDAGQKKGHLFRRLGSRTKEIITNLIPFYGKPDLFYSVFSC